MASTTPDPAVIQALAHQLSTAFTHITASRYLSFAGFVVLIYDHLLTFADEVELIWLKPMSLVTMLFLFNRYLVPLIIMVDLYDKGGFARNVPNLFCHIWFMFEANAQVVCFGVTHFLVALRVRALWATKPWLDKLLLVTGVTYFVLTLTFTNVASIKVLHTLVWNSEFNLCFATPPEWTYVVWIPALVFEVMVFGFMITKAMQHARRHVAMPVAQVLYRDGVLYFGVIAACSVFNILAWSVLPKTLILLAKYFTFSFINAMSSRLVLNLRGMGRERDKGPWTTDQSKGAVELYNFRPSTALSGRPNVKGSIMAYQPPKPLPVLPKPPTVLTRKQSILRSMDRHGDVTASNTTGTESRLGFYPVTASLQIQVDVDVDVDGDEGDETSCSDTHPSNEKMGWESEPPV